MHPPAASAHIKPSPQVPPMSDAVRLVLALHNHQPVGNFDGVIQEALAESYATFLDVLEDFHDIAIVMHT